MAERENDETREPVRILTEQEMRMGGEEARERLHLLTEQLVRMGSNKEPIPLRMAIGFP